MKMKAKINNKEQVIDIDFWDFFKGFIYSYALISIVLFGIGFLIGYYGA